MATVTKGEERQHPPEPDNLSCPRCDSTSTKFCYYNNYNLSQPRYFCKSCRRFWTRGGTLRNIPVGGGSRKNSKPKRYRSSSSAAATTIVTPLPPPPPAVVNTMMEIPSPLRNDDVEFDLNDEGSFTSLLLTASDDISAVVNEVGPFMGLPGYGLSLGPGFGVGSLNFEETGLEFGASLTDDDKKIVGQNDGSETWQFGSGDGVDSPDCFDWSELAISTSGQGLD